MLNSFCKCIWWVMNNKFFLSLLVSSALLATMNVCVAMDHPEDLPQKSILQHPFSFRDNNERLQAIRSAKAGDKEALEKLSFALGGKNKSPILSPITQLIVQGDQKGIELFYELCIEDEDNLSWMKSYNEKLQNNKEPTRAAEVKRQLPLIKAAIDGYENFKKHRGDTEYQKYLGLWKKDPPEAVRCLLRGTICGSKDAIEALNFLSGSEGYEDPNNADKNDLGALLKKEQGCFHYERYVSRFSNYASVVQFFPEQINTFAIHLFKAVQLDHEQACRAAEELRGLSGYQDEAKRITSQRIDPFYLLGRALYRFESLNEGLEKTMRALHREEKSPLPAPQQKKTPSLKNSSPLTNKKTIVPEPVNNATYQEVFSLMDKAKARDPEAYAKYLALVKKGDMRCYILLMPYLETNDPEAYALVSGLCQDSMEAIELLLDFTEELRNSKGRARQVDCLEKAFICRTSLSKENEQKYFLNRAKELGGKDNRGCIKALLYAAECGSQEATAELDRIEQSKGYRNPHKAPKNDLGALLKESAVKKAEHLYCLFLEESHVLPKKRAAALHASAQAGNTKAKQKVKEIERNPGYQDAKVGKQPNNPDPLYLVAYAYAMLENKYALQNACSQNTIPEAQKPALSEEKGAESPPKGPCITFIPEGAETASKPSDASPQTPPVITETKVEAPEGKAPVNPSPKSVSSVKESKENDSKHTTDKKDARPQEKETSCDPKGNQVVPAKSNLRYFIPTLPPFDEAKVLHDLPFLNRQGWITGQWGKNNKYNLVDTQNPENKAGGHLGHGKNGNDALDRKDIKADIDKFRANLLLSHNMLPQNPIVEGVVKGVKTAKKVAKKAEENVKKVVKEVKEKAKETKKTIEGTVSSRDKKEKS
jgi:hypothetical protein